MSTGRLTTTSYVVLGMIAMRGPTTSYDLKRAVNHSVGYFWPFPHAQLYSEPKRLEELGLLDLEVESEGRRRQTYTITDAGRDALRAWLAEPTTEQLQVRDVAELKLFFGEFARHGQQFHFDNLKTAFFKTGENFAAQPARHGVGFQNNECFFHSFFGSKAVKG